MMKLKRVEARPGRSIYVEFVDGVRGIVDLSNLEGKGVFAIWNTPGVFESVRIGDAGQIAWGEQVDICADAVYLELTGKTPEEAFGVRRQAHLHA